MATTLHTQITANGAELTLPNGDNAGFITAKTDLIRGYPYLTYAFTSLFGTFNGPTRRTLEAAQFDALAHAADNTE